MIKAILFDFNGVIIDDEPIQMRAYQEILKGEDIELTEADYNACFGMDDKAFIEAQYARVGKTPETNKVLKLRSPNRQNGVKWWRTSFRFLTESLILSRKWRMILRSALFRWRGAKKSSSFWKAPDCSTVLR